MRQAKLNICTSCDKCTYLFEALHQNPRNCQWRTSKLVVNVVPLFYAPAITNRWYSSVGLLRYASGLSISQQSSAVGGTEPHLAGFSNPYCTSPCGLSVCLSDIAYSCRAYSCAYAWAICSGVASVAFGLPAITPSSSASLGGCP